MENSAVKHKLDRRAIFRDAHKRFRDGRRLGLGWTFARCLRMAWTTAKLRAEFPVRRYNPDTHNHTAFA